MAEGSRKVNWFAIWVSVGVVAVLLAVALFVVILNNQSADPEPGQTPSASNIDADTGAILVGDGSNSLDTYIDFMCPICNQFEQVYGEAIATLVDDGSITLGIHPISILDAKSQGTEFSTRAANAMYCVAVADAEASVPFMNAMFANQPQEGTPGLTDDEILQIAESVGVTGIESCVTDGVYSDYVTAMTQETPVRPGAGGIGTPTVLLNGEFVALTGDPEADLRAALP